MSDPNATPYERIVSLMRNYPTELRSELASHHDAILTDWLDGHRFTDKSTLDISMLILSALTDAEKLLIPA